MHFDVNSTLDPLAQLKYTKLPIFDFLLDKLKQIHGMKINILLKKTFVKQDGKEQNANFKTRVNEYDMDHSKR